MGRTGTRKKKQETSQKASADVRLPYSEEEYRTLMQNHVSANEEKEILLRDLITQQPGPSGSDTRIRMSVIREEDETMDDDSKEDKPVKEKEETVEKPMETTTVATDSDLQASEIWFKKREGNFINPTGPTKYGNAAIDPSPPPPIHLEYGVVEDFFGFDTDPGTGNIQSTSHVAPAAKEPHFSCFPMIRENGFVVHVYFVNILSSLYVLDSHFLEILKALSGGIGKHQLLPNRHIAVPNLLNAAYFGNPLQIALAAKDGPELCIVQFVYAGCIQGESLTVQSTDILHNFVADMLLREARLWHFGSRYFVYEERQIIDTKEPEKDYLALGTGFRVTLANQGGNPVIMLEPFIYLRDTRGVLSKMKADYLKGKDVASTIKGMNIMTNCGMSSHNVTNFVKPKKEPTAHDSPAGLAEHFGRQVEFPNQPVMYASFPQRISGSGVEVLLIPEYCEEFKLCMVTKNHLRNKSLSSIVGTVDTWDERMEIFLKLIHIHLNASFQWWKIGFGLTPINSENNLPEFGITDPCNWFQK